MRPDLTADLHELFRSRVALPDGAMGTTIREYRLSESAARGDRFTDAPKDLLNNGDILSLSQPDTIGDIHRRFSPWPLKIHAKALYIANIALI